MPTHTQTRPDSEEKSSEEKASRAGKRKTKENYRAKSRDKVVQNLPSVPSTQHIAPQRMF